MLPKIKNLNGNNYWYRDQPIRVPGTLLQLSDIAPTRKHSPLRSRIDKVVTGLLS